MINEIPTPENGTSPSKEERPCSEYRQFLDSTPQERTFMIGKLVDTFANVIDSIWHPKYVKEQTKVMPTRGFCTEILKRSKTTYTTLQVSLFYIFRIKKVVTEKLIQRSPSDELICCGRRMFLASLMVASKYLHDKNYHNKAWSTITGLSIKEINAAELAFLKLIDYKLHVSKPTFDRWYSELHGHIHKEFKASVNYPSPPYSACSPNDSPPPHFSLASPPILPRADSGISMTTPEMDNTTLKRKHKDEIELVNKKCRC